MQGIVEQIRSLVRSATNHGRRIRRLETLPDPVSITRPQGGHIIQDEGVSLPDQVYLDFIGVGVTAEDDLENGKTTVTIPGAIQEIINIIDGANLDRIILIHANGGGVVNYDPTEAGLTLALANALSGDVIYLPPATIGGNHTIPAGIMIRGWYYQSVLSGTITNNGIVVQVRITGSISNGTATAFYRVFDGASIDHTVYGSDVDLRWQFGNAGLSPSFTVISLDASGKAAAMIAGTLGAGVVAQNDGPFTFSEDSRANFLADDVGDLGGGDNKVHMAIFPTTGNVRVETDATVPLYGDPGYKFYIDGTLYVVDQITNEISTGTAPFIIASTTLVTNLNADMVDGYHAAALLANDDEKAKVSANDTTAGYLNGKLIGGTGITLTEGNDGGDETLSIAVDMDASELNTLWEPLTNGDAAAPEIIFADGDVIMVEVAR